MTDAAEHIQMLKDCVERESRLSDWERKFVDSLGAQLDAGCSLSERQSEKLEQIWRAATERG